MYRILYEKADFCIVEQKLWIEHLKNDVSHWPMRVVCCDD